MGVAPHSLVISSTRGSSLDTATSPTPRLAFACSIVHRTQGLPARSAVFFPGSPLLPARARTIARAC